MRLRVFSDLHIDAAGPHGEVDVTDCDAIAICGDVSERLSTRALGWLQEHVAPAGVPVLYVPGNHDFYHTRFPRELDKARPRFEQAGIHLLAQGESVVIDDVLFVGATLWTDYQIAGDTHSAMLSAASKNGGMNDHRLIRDAADPGRPFLPHHALAEHKRALDNIRAELGAREPGQASVLLTHHGVSPRSLQHGEVETIADACYASDLEDLICAYAPDLVVHGHVHVSVDYEIGTTRVISNPAGYRRKLHNGWELENPAFAPSYTVEVGPRPAPAFGR